MTYIKRMVIHGFKSFAKRTEIVFDKNVTTIVGPNGAGKSCSYDTIVTLADGREIEIGKLVEEQIKQTKNIKKLDDGIYVDGDGPHILSLNKDSMKIEKKIISKFIKRSGEEIYRIKTRTGKEVKATGCHPVMTFLDGEIKSSLIRDLRVGSLIASPRLIKVDSDKGDTDLARLIGYIIGDGYIQKNRIEFVNNDKEVLKDYKSLIKKRSKWGIRERLDKNSNRVYTRDKDFVKTVRDLFYKDFKGNITSEIKSIPSSIIKADKESLSNLLAGLFDTDGSIRKDVAIVEYCTKNKNLARQIQGLLLRFGIISKIKMRKCAAINTIAKVKRDYYYLYIYGKDNLKKFYENIPLRVAHKRENLIRHVEKDTIGNPNIDILPKDINVYIKEASNLLGIRAKPLKRNYPTLSAYIENVCAPSRTNINKVLYLFNEKLNYLTSLYNRIAKDQLSLVNCMDCLNLSSWETARAIGLYQTTIRDYWATNKYTAKPDNLEKFYDLIRKTFEIRFSRIKELMTLLYNVANSDIFWDEIISIEKLPKEEYVYDLAIEDNHNFIANNIFVHNSNLSDSLCFVLGRLSIKSMRAAKAKNLLFMGSKYVKPAHEAYVELVFDNSQRTFALDAGEVVLKRIVKHSGQSIYKINNETKTRAEVIEVLASAGIDPYGFNIILQGQIDSLIKMRPEERRGIIEEVAGIAIYEARKQKSLHELEKTDEKLKEISSVLRERKLTLRNLEEERASALKFKELETVVKRTKASILHKKITEKKKEIESIANSIEKGEKEKGKIKEKIEEETKDVEKRIERINQITKYVQKATGLEQEALHEQIANLKAELEGLRVRKESYENRKLETERRIEELEKNIPDFESEIEELKSKSPLVAKKQDELRRKKEELAQIEEERKKLIKTKNELELIKEKTKDRAKQLGKIEAESDSLLKQIEEQSTNLLHKNEENCMAAIKSLREELDLRIADLKKVDKGEIENEKIISIREKEVSDAEKIKEKVKELDVCPLCQSKITEKHIEHVNEEADKKIKEAREELEKINLGLKNIAKSKLKLDSEIKEIENKISGGEIELVKHRAIHEKKERLKKALDEQNALKEEIKNIELKRDLLEKKIAELAKADESYDSKLLEIEEISSRTEENVDTAIAYKEREIESMMNAIKRSKEGLDELETNIGEIAESIDAKAKGLGKKENEERELNEKFKKMFNERDALQAKAQEQNLELANKQSEARDIDDQINYYKIGRAKLDAEREALEMEMKDFAGIEIMQGSMAYLEERLKKAQESMQLIGSINMRALEVYDSIKAEYDKVEEKVNILVNEKEGILNIIEEIDNKKKRTFMKTFRELNERFSDNFARVLSAKGTACLEIENKEDIFAGGVDIAVKMAKGKHFDVSSLSGGEQALVALSLLFAIQEYKPYHFYIFDEIDAALDKRNSERLALLLNQYMKAGQYIVITHNDALILNSNVLYGVSMHERVSKILSLKVKEVGEAQAQNQQVEESVGEMKEEAAGVNPEVGNVNTENEVSGLDSDIG